MMPTTNHAFGKSSFSNRSYGERGEESQAQPISSLPSKKDTAQSSAISKRQHRLAHVINPGADEKAKGDVIRGSGNTLVWWNETRENEDGTKGTWEEAVYHNDIRQHLLTSADGNGRVAYDFPRNEGSDLYDKTAFLASQKAWRGENKKYWSTIADDILNRFEPNGYRNPEYEIPVMRFRNKVVLDHDNHPVRLFRDLPLTLSSAVEPWLLEAVTRIDKRILKVDIRARMPATFTDKHGKPQKVYGLAALGNKAMRFREMYGLVSWTSRAGSEVWKQKVLRVMTKEQIASNTTTGLRKFPTRGIDVNSRRNSPKGSRGLRIQQWDPEKVQGSRVHKTKTPMRSKNLNQAPTQSNSSNKTAREQSKPGGYYADPSASVSDDIDDARLVLQRQYIEAMQEADKVHTAFKSRNTIETQIAAGNSLQDSALTFQASTQGLKEDDIMDGDMLSQEDFFQYLNLDLDGSFV